MSRQLALGGRQFLILSEPNDRPAWRATVIEVKPNGAQEEVAIDATADTRAAADDAAERELRRLVRSDA